MTTNLGTSALFDNVGAVTLIGNIGTRDLLVYQNNSTAPYVMQTVLSESGTTNPAFLNKFGAGTMELENQNTYSGGTKIYEGMLRVDAIGNQSLFTTAVGGAVTAQNTYGSLGVSVRTNASPFLGWTNSVSVFGGILAQAAPNTNVVPITVFSGATNDILLGAANLQVRDGTSLAVGTETVANSSTNFILTYNSGARLQFAYANGIALSATIAPLLVTNAYNSSPLVANGTVTIDVLSGNLSVGQFPLISYSGSIGGSGGSAFVLGTIEPHASGFISNNLANNSIDLVVTSAPQPLHWAVSNGTWDIGLTANWKDNVGNTTTYQQIGSLADNVSFDDSSSGVSPITITLNASPIPNSVTVTGSKNYTISGSGGISGLGSVTKSGSDSLSLQTSNSFTGGLNINGGILNFTALTNLGGGSINFGGGTLQYNGNSDDISILPVKFNTGGGTINLNGNAVSFANAIGNSGTGGFTLTGNNTLQINRTNLYSGNTIINPGSTLAFQSANTYISNSAALIVNGTLDVTAGVNANGFGLTLSTPASQILAGTGTVMGEVSMGGGTTISPATNGTYGTLTIAGDLTINGGTLAMDIAGPTGGSKDTLAITAGVGSGNLTLGSGLNSGTILLNVSGTLNNGTYPLITYSGTLNGSAGNLNLAGFNQPGSLAFLTSGSGTIVLNVISGNTNKLVWGNSGLNNNAWDIHNSVNWVSNGIAGQVFDNGDVVTFDDTGLASSPVSLGDNGVSGSGTIIPGAVVLNVTNNNYIFQDGVGDGSGKLLGATALTINSSVTNTTTMLTQNGNSGPTTIKGGTLQIGNGSVTADIGTGNVTNNGNLIFDQTDNRTVQGQMSGTGNLIQEGSAILSLLANNSYTGQTIISNAISGLTVGTGGTVGTLGAGAIVDNGFLTINRSGSFAMTNISGAGSVAFVGSPTITLAGATYQGNTYITNGSLKVLATNEIPSAATVNGSTGVLGLGGTLDLNGTNLTVNGLTDLGLGTGLITNSAASGINILTLGTGSVSNSLTFSGNILDITNRAGIELVINNPGITILTGQGSTYRGGIILGQGELQLGQGGPNINGGPSAGTGGIFMSNATTLMMGGNNITFVANPVTIAPHSTITIAEAVVAAYSDAYSGLVSGDAFSTNMIANQTTYAGAGAWNAFPGTVLIPSGAGLRGNGSIGGTNTTLEIDGTGVFFARNAADVDTFGALTGNGAITAPTTAGATIVIGTKGVDSTFIGSITGGYNITKTGAGKLTLNGSTNNFTTTINDDGSITTNYFMASGLTYVGATTVSNGVLAIVAPSSLNGTNFTSFNLVSSTAVLDISSAGFTPDTLTLVTNSTLALGSPQTLTGIGTIRGSLIASNGTTISVGFPSNTNNAPVTGSLTITNSVELGGVVNINLDRTNSAASGEIISPAITVDPTAVLVVTNVGPGLIQSNTFTLFSRSVSGFASVTLPATDPTGLTNYVWANNLASNGTVQLIGGGLPAVTLATNPTNIMVSVSGGNLSLSWPADHLGWFLQVQTNALSSGLGTNWVDVPGSSSVTSVVVPVNPGNPTVFYRMSLNP